MSIQEAQSTNDESVRNVLENIASTKLFDTFVSLQRLAQFSSDSGISPERWDILLEEWDYEPVSFLRDNGRGNCVDFACYAQQALMAIGSRTEVIGQFPGPAFTYEQTMHATYRHVTLLSSLGSGRAMFEAGWKLPKPIPIEPVGEEVAIGNWKLKTIAIDEATLSQAAVTPYNSTWDRVLGLQSLEKDELTQLTKKLLRIPRELAMITRLDPDIPDLIISHDPETDIVKGNLYGSNEAFVPSEMTTRSNEKISDIFGFDVKEELLASLALRSAFPESFWIK